MCTYTYLCMNLLNFSRSRSFLVFLDYFFLLEDRVKMTAHQLDLIFSCTSV